MDDKQNENTFELSQQDIDIIGEVNNISMGSAATALSNIMGKKVIITSPQVEVGTSDSIGNIERVPSLGVVISYTEGVIGKDILIIKKQDAVEIVKALMGGDMPDDEFGEIQISAIAEVMNQMMGSAATALSNFIGRAVNISPPSAFMLTEDNIKEKLAFVYEQANRVVMVKFLFKVEDVFESDLYVILPQEFTEELVNVMIKNLGLDGTTANSSGGEAGAGGTPPQAPQAEAPAAPTPQSAPQMSQQQVPQQQMPQQQMPQQQMPQQQVPQQQVPQQQMPQQQMPQQQMPQQQMPPQQMPQQQVPQQQVPQQQMPPQYYAPAASQSAATAVPLAQAPSARVRPAQFMSFDSAPEMKPAEKSNFELIEDVPLELSVEVGKAYKLVKEIIDFTVGSIIELDKQAGDPVDIIVNGQLIAHGEVVVIDESFGVRITEIIDPKNKGK